MPLTFEHAVKSCSLLAGYYCSGLNALSQANRQKIFVTSSTIVTGSINIDVALQAALPNDPRWDYGIGWRRSKLQAKSRNDSVCWIEIHQAYSSSDMETVLTKLAFHRQWLKDNAPELDSLHGKFVWVATGKVGIPKHHRRKMSNEGLTLKGQRHQL